MEKTEDYFIKLSGKAFLEEPLQIAHNIHVITEGSIVSKNESDNEDGTFTITYKFVPVRIEVVTDKGKRIKTKDTRSRSQQLRGVIWKQWQTSGQEISEDEFYDRKMREIIAEQMEI